MRALCAISLRDYRGKAYSYFCNYSLELASKRFFENLYKSSCSLPYALRVGGLKPKTAQGKPNVNHCIKRNIKHVCQLSPRGGARERFVIRTPFFISTYCRQLTLKSAQITSSITSGILLTHFLIARSNYLNKLPLPLGINRAGNAYKLSGAKFAPGSLFNVQFSTRTMFSVSSLF